MSAVVWTEPATLTPAPEQRARARLTVDQRTGPRTLTGPGETCLLCGDAMDAGEVYLFVQDPDGAHGVAHESCLEEHATIGSVVEKDAW